MITSAKTQRPDQTTASGRGATASEPADDRSDATAPPTTDDRLLTAAEVAERLGVSAKTLANWNSAGIAPPSLRLPSGIRRWRASDLAAWIDAAEAA
jgi:predicted DNA-binding transcriptional regulator AlpA